LILSAVSACTSAAAADSSPGASAYVSIRQHTSAYAGIRQHTSATYTCQRGTYRMRMHTSTYVDIRASTRDVPQDVLR
jgi:hypothetical protein